MDRTYIMLKPDALKRGLAGEILARIEKKGYKYSRPPLFSRSGSLYDFRPRSRYDS